MKFRIEQVYLTDDEGHVVERPGSHPTHHIAEADDVELALEQFISSDRAEIVGNALRFPGFQVVATVKRNNSVYTLQIVPVTDQQFRIR